MLEGFWTGSRGWLLITVTCASVSCSQSSLGSTTPTTRKVSVWIDGKAVVSIPEVPEAEAAVIEEAGLAAPKDPDAACRYWGAWHVKSSIGPFGRRYGAAAKEAWCSFAIRKVEAAEAEARKKQAEEAEGRERVRRIQDSVRPRMTAGLSTLIATAKKESQTGRCDQASVELLRWVVQEGQKYLSTMSASDHRTLGTLEQHSLLVAQPKGASFTYTPALGGEYHVFGFSLVESGFELADAQGYTVTATSIWALVPGWVAAIAQKWAGTTGWHQIYHGDAQEEFAKFLDGVDPGVGSWARSKLRQTRTLSVDALDKLKIKLTGQGCVLVMAFRRS